MDISGKVDKILITVTEIKTEVRTIKERGCEVGHIMEGRITKKVDRMYRFLAGFSVIGAIIAGAMSYFKLN